MSYSINNQENYMSSIYHSTIYDFYYTKENISSLTDTRSNGTHFVISYANNQEDIKDNEENTAYLVHDYIN